jgi:hypothetical protein
MPTVRVSDGMSLGGIIDRVHRRERRVTLLSPPTRAVVRAVRRRFGPQGVPVSVARAAAPPTAMVHDDREVITVVPLAPPNAAGFEVAVEALTDALAALDRTTFVSRERSEMFAATREIEDRAWRVGGGRLRAGFQRVAALADQSEVYARLSERLDTHAYAVPDGTPPDMGDTVVHLEPTREIERSWFVVYDGDGRPADKCALVAAEDDAGEFSGFLTYDPDLVDEVDRYVATTY